MMVRGAKAKKLRVTKPAALKIDFGCGTRKKAGFLGVDVRKFEGVDVVLNAGTARWPWPDNAVAEAHASHVIEHLTQAERCHFFNELYRVLAPGAQATIVTPHWCSTRAYGDPTHVWPPVCEMWWYYLDEAWRTDQAPHVCDMLSCNFKGTTWVWSLHPALNGRNTDYQTQALTFWKEAAQDMIATLTK